jgi:hypothetical protein
MLFSFLTLCTLLVLCKAKTSTSTYTEVTCSTKLGKSSVRSVPTSTGTKTSTQKAKITITSTPVVTDSVTLATTELSIVTIFDYDQTTTDYDTTLSSTTLTITPIVITSSTIVYSITSTTETVYSTVPAPSNWLPINDTTSSVYPQQQKGSARHRNARRDARPAAPAPTPATSSYPQSVKCKSPSFSRLSNSYMFIGSETVEIQIVSTETKTASTTSTMIVQPTSFSYLTITQFALTTVYPASTTFTVTAATPIYGVSTVTDIATLTATLTLPTYAACSSSNELSTITFANGTVGYPIAPSAMGNSTSLFLVSSQGGVSVDCCAECFSTLGCAGAYTSASMISPLVCYLFVDEADSDGAVCRQQDLFGAYQWEQGIMVEEEDGPFENLWNGPCGFLYLTGWNGR